jgi:hypothetical protein
MYDLDHEFVANTPAEHARIARLKRKEAQTAVATMEETVAQNRAEEEKKGGLLILAARYGDLSASEVDQSKAVSAPYIDVSVPLQCMVHDSALILPEGRSRFWLEGFYDPSMGASPESNRLYIRYKFLGQLHEAEFGDQEAVAIPVEEHCIEGQIDETQEIEGLPTRSRDRSGMFATSAAARTAQRERQKARRRYVLYTSIVLFGVGMYMLKRNGVTVASAQQSVQTWTDWLRATVQERVTEWTAKLAPQTKPTTTKASSTTQEPRAIKEVSA